MYLNMASLAVVSSLSCFMSQYKIQYGPWSYFIMTLHRASCLEINSQVTYTLPRESYSHLSLHRA